MRQPQTESLSDAARGLDALGAEEVARRLHAAQMDALGAVGSALAEIAAGAEVMAEAIRSGRGLHFAAAGSSGLMAAADAAELPGTFGIPPERVAVHMAGGVPAGSEMPGRTEDDAAAAEEALRLVAPGDAVVAVSASGSTPFAVAAARFARSRGATTICMANNADAPLFEHATVAISLPTPPELVAGSTRMGAGTAQKAALNIMSTLMGVALGHVHDGMMVNARVDNEKLRRRAVGMVSRIANVTEDRARGHLETAFYEVKPAVLLAAGAGSRDRADALLAECGGRLRAALARLGPN